MNEGGAVNNWFYEEGGERKGPVPQSEMTRLVKSGVISRKNLVWKQGFSDWIPMESTELSGHVDIGTPPPLSGDRVNDAMVWILALMPIVGLIFLKAFASIFGRGSALSRFYGGQIIPAIIFFAFYLWLIRVDEKRIKTAGHNYDKISSWAWLVPPVYLYQRAKSLNQNLIHFYFWIGSFIASLFL